jgi:hypothetical protein
MVERYLAYKILRILPANCNNRRTCCDLLEAAVMCWNLPRPLLEIAAGRWDKLEIAGYGWE